MLNTDIRIGFYSLDRLEGTIDCINAAGSEGSIAFRFYVDRILLIDHLFGFSDLIYYSMGFNGLLANESDLADS